MHICRETVYRQYEGVAIIYSKRNNSIYIMYIGTSAIYNNIYLYMIGVFTGRVIKNYRIVNTVHMHGRRLQMYIL